MKYFTQTIKALLDWTKMYRLHIDIPLPYSEEEALKVSELLVGCINTNILIERTNIEQINYRVGHDDDRQRSNYLMKDANGHVSNKKCKIVIKEITSGD